MTMLIILFCLLIGGFLFYASYSISSGVYLKVFCKAATTEKAVAITFDDGPDNRQTPLVLDILNQHNVEAAFFCIGEKAAQSPDLTRRIHDEGHLIGNHSFRHKGSFPLLSYRPMRADLIQTQQTLEAITGSPVTLFRPPFGVTNPTIGRAVHSLGYKAIGWNIRSLDTKGEPVGKIMKRITKQIHPGAVILLHDRMPDSAELLTALLTYLHREGYAVKRVDKLLNI